MNKGNPKSSEAESASFREKAARQIKDSEEAAKEVADLCAQAAEKARRHHLPNAGVGSTTPAQD
jgi:pyrroloquinoline quinone (PQQ) biosynthesis protein C